MSELPTGFFTASHAVLFEEVEANEHRCDVCSAPVSRDDEDREDQPFNVSGRGLLVWTRGEERRYQEPPLCPGCAAAVGMTALSRWETEEDEG